MDSDVLKLFGVMLAITTAGSIGYVVIALVNVMVKRLEGRKPAGTEQLEAEMSDLRARLDDADAARGRIAELEERLDFAERMLAQQRDAPRVGPGGRLMFKKYVGLDFLDLLIHAGVTFAACVMLASVTSPDEETGVAIGFGVSLIVLAWRRKRALAALPEYSTGEVQAERIADLEARLAELEAGQGRVLELEERLDFTERMLTRQRESEPARLSPGERP